VKMLAEQIRNPPTTEAPTSPPPGEQRNARFDPRYLDVDPRTARAEAPQDTWPCVLQS